MYLVWRLDPWPPAQGANTLPLSHRCSTWIDIIACIHLSKSRVCGYQPEVYGYLSGQHAYLSAVEEVADSEDGRQDVLEGLVGVQLIHALLQVHQGLSHFLQQQTHNQSDNIRHTSHPTQGLFGQFPFWTFPLLSFFHHNSTSGVRNGEIMWHLLRKYS